MPHVTSGVFKTEHGAKYIAQLCKHFAHKITARYSDTEGRADLPIDPAFMTATADALYIRIELNDPELEKRGHHIIDSHLARFAFRKDFTVMDWNTSTGETE